MATTCSTCQAEIRWVVTVAGRRMPLDPAKVADGNVIPEVQADGSLRAKVVGGDQLPVEGGAWQSHHRTCPEAAQHKRRKTATIARCPHCGGRLHQLAVDAGWPRHPLCGPPPDFRVLAEGAAP